MDTSTHCHRSRPRPQLIVLSAHLTCPLLDVLIQSTDGVALYEVVCDEHIHRVIRDIFFFLQRVGSTAHT